MADEKSKQDHVFAMSELWKNIYPWFSLGKGLEIVFGIGTASWAGISAGWWAGILTSLIFLAHLVSSVWLHFLPKKEESQDQPATDPDAIGRLQKQLKIANAFGGFLVVIIIAYLVGGGAWRLFTTRTPKQVEIASANRMDNAEGKQFLNRNLFIQAIIDGLERETQEFKGKTMIAQKPTHYYLIKTKPLSHPTRDFGVRMSYEQQLYDISGYGFRMRMDEDREMFEAVSMNFAVRNKVGFELTPSESGDYLLAVVRLSSDKSELPADLVDKLKIEVFELSPKEKK